MLCWRGSAPGCAVPMDWGSSLAKANFGGTLRALLRLLSPAPGQIAVEAIALSEAGLEVWGHVVANTAACPTCRGGRSRRLPLSRRACQGSGAGAREDLPRVVGVDDWAWRRGSRSGTIVCDLECRRPLDLLPDREVASTATWLAAHPRITVVSRDRGGAYADAPRQGAPEPGAGARRWAPPRRLRA